jgi:hypothetical protein
MVKVRENIQEQESIKRLNSLHRVQRSSCILHVPSALKEPKELVWPP